MNRFCDPYSKIMVGKDAIGQISRWRFDGFKIVAVDAVLDIPHYRHADYFLACANLGDKLVVRIPSDELVSRKKDPCGPIVPWKERARHAAHYPYIDLISDKLDFSADWLRAYHPDVVVRSITSGQELIDEAENLIPE
jgi:glycerol-3-phosphate cytidylyltransferase-like family protein